MNKRNFLKQLKRAENLHKEEIEEMKKDESQGYIIGEYWKAHMEGHVYFNEILIRLCNDSNSMEDIKKFIKKHKTAVRKVLKTLEEIYNCTEMPKLVDKEYNFNHGIECYLTFIEGIIRGRKYISKAYEE